MTRHKRLRLFASFVVAFLAAVYWTQRSASNASLESHPVPPSVPAAVSTSTNDVATSPMETNAIVVRVVDGDTLIVKLDREKDENTVRMLGVNTPESVDPRRPVQCFGKEASAFTASLANGRRVKLEADPLADEVDKYGRLLRNVILPDGSDLNARLVREGFAYAYLSFPLDAKRKTQLKRLQEEAKAAKRGLWNPRTCGGKK